MKEQILSEILLTSDHVKPASWLTLFDNISKLNGLFKTWSIYAKIEVNEVHFYCQTSRILPPIINSLGDFMIRKLDITQNDLIPFLNKKGKPFLLTNKEKNMLDVFDKAETSRGQKLKVVKMCIFSYRKSHFFTKTHLFFQKANRKKWIKRKALLAIPHYLFSIDFSIYNRFFYQKYENEYLTIQKSLPLFVSEKQNAILKIDTFPYLAEEYYLSQNHFDSDQHSIIIGSSGTGKSKLASSIIANMNQEINFSTNYKVVVIDPHAALEKEIGGLDHTKVIDFKNLDTSSDLFMNSQKKDIVSSVELILSLFQTLMDDQYNSRLERVLRHSIHLLMEANCLNFINLKKLILDMKYRNNLIHEMQNRLSESTVNFFLTDFNQLKSNSYQEAIAPIISFIDEMELLPAFQKEGLKPQVKDILSQNFLTIFSLDQATLGQKVTKTISGLIMQQLLEFIQSFTYKEHILLVIDEVALVENPILSRFLAEARKYNLSLILIQQYFNQISENLRSAIFANVANFYVFRVSKSDAMLLENNMHMEVAVRNAYRIRLKMLTELNNRECIVRISKNGFPLPAFKAKTLDFTSFPRRHMNQILRTDPLLKDFKTIEEIPKKMDSLSKKDFSFQIGESVDSLLELMRSQSTSRKKVEENG